MMNKGWSAVVKHIICIFLCLLIIMPFYMILINSFKSKSESARMSLSLPTVWHFDTYLHVIRDANLVESFFNSLLYSTVSTVIGVIACAMAAFVISRNKTKLNQFFYYFIISGLFFPVNYVTLVKILRIFQLVDTKTGIIVAFTSSMIPFCIFTIRNFVSSIPMELDEAALIDGCGPVRMFFSIIAPLMKPTLATCFILQFMGVWTNFMTPLYLSSKGDLFPMTMTVYQFFGKNKSMWNYVFADLVLTCIPVIIVYLVGQKYIMGGMTAGGVKE